MSQVVRHWQVGDWLDIRGPFGNLQYTPNEVSAASVFVPKNFSRSSFMRQHFSTNNVSYC